MPRVDIEDPEEAGRLLQDAQYRVLWAADALRARAREIQWTSPMLDLVSRAALEDPLYMPLEWLAKLDAQAREQGDAELCARASQLHMLLSNVSVLRSGCGRSVDRIRRSAALGALLERRRAQRVPIDLVVTWVRDDGLVRGRCRNISQSGMMIEIEPCPARGRTFDLQVRLPGRDRDDRLRMRSMWESEATQDRARAIGASFVEVDTAARDTIARLVAARASRWDAANPSGDATGYGAANAEPSGD
jgi:hypothetical protein